MDTDSRQENTKKKTQLSGRNVRVLFFTVTIECERRIICEFGRFRLTCSYVVNAYLRRRHIEHILYVVAFKKNVSV